MSVHARGHDVRRASIEDTERIQGMSIALRSLLEGAQLPDWRAKGPREWNVFVLLQL